MIYSPSSTVDWLRCPTYAKWRNAVVPRTLEPSPAMLIGRAMAAGLAAYFKGSETPWSDIASQAAEWLDTEWPDETRWTHTAIIRLMERALTTAIEQPEGARAIRDTETIVAVEQTIGECRPDLVTRNRDGELVVTDAKYNHDVKSEWVPKRLQGVRFDWQLHHYAWAVGAYYGEPVAWIRRHLVVGSPKAISRLVQFRVTAPQTAQWLSYAEWVWEQMTRERAGNIPIGTNYASCDGKFGLCSLIPFCHDFHCNLDAARVLYDIHPNEKG